MKISSGGPRGRTWEPAPARRRRIGTLARPSRVQPAWALHWLADLAYAA